MLTQFLHVQVAPARNPLLTLLDRQRANQPQARLPVWEDPHHPRPSLYLLVEPLQTIGGADALAVRLGKSQADEALLHLLFKMLGYPCVALLAPLLGYQRGQSKSPTPIRSGEERPEIRPELLASGCSDHMPRRFLL